MKTIMRVNPTSYRTIPDVELDEAILDALDEYGRDANEKGGGYAPTTTLVALSVTEKIVKRDHGDGVVADGVVVEVRRVARRLARLETAGKARGLKLPGRRETRWWHNDHWQARTLREEERRHAVEQRNEQARLVRERWAATGYPILDVDVVTGVVTLDKERAEQVVEVLEETRALVNAARAQRGEEPL